MHYAPILLTLLYAVLGVFGKTWEPDKPGWKRITWKGWIVIVLALVSAGLTIWTADKDRSEKSAYRTIALAEVTLATDRLLDPFRSLYVIYRGPSSDPQIGGKLEREALAQKREQISAQSLVSDDFLTYLGQTDVLSQSSDVRTGSRLPYLDNLAVRTEEGLKKLEKALKLGSDLLPVGVRTSALAVIHSPYAQTLVLRPSHVRRLPSGTIHTILPAQGSKHAALIEDYKAYVALITTLNAAAAQGE